MTEQTDINPVEDLDVSDTQQTEQNDIDTLQARIAELESELKSAKEGQARANADSYNAQRRMEQETEKAKKFALQKFAKEMLNVVDNLERAIDNTTDEQALEGIKLTHKSLIGVLERHGVVAVGDMGETFNPDLHEAVGIAQDADKDVIGQVLQKGYTLNERTLRPAMVLVGG